MIDVDDGIISDSVSSISSISSSDDTVIFTQDNKFGGSSDSNEESFTLYACIVLGIIIFFGYIAYTKFFNKNPDDKSNNNCKSSCCFANICS